MCAVGGCPSDVRGPDSALPDTSVADVGTDAAMIDAGPWPAFAPRLQVSHPEIVCPAWAGVTYAGPARPPAAPGDVRFVSPLSGSGLGAAWTAIFDGAPPPPMEVSSVALTGLPDGGVGVPVLAQLSGRTYGARCT